MDRIRSLLAHPRWPGVAQAAALALGVLAVGAIFVGPDQGERNLGNFLLWHLWWAGLPVAALLLGRAWCAVCPVSLLDAALPQRRLRPVSWPAALRGAGGPLLAASILLAHLANLWFRFEDSAPASRGFVAAMVAAAAAFTLLVRERAWCRSLCPAGAFSGVLARAARWRIVLDAERCGRNCAGAFCRGEAAAAGCPAGEDLRRGIDPGTCLLCGDCLSSCPAVGPARASSLALPRLAVAPTLVLLGVIVDGLLVQINDWPVLYWRLCNALGVEPGAWRELGLHALVVATPLLVATAFSALAGKAANAERLAFIAGAALPIAAAAAAAVAARELLVTAPRHLGELLAATGHGGLGIQAASRLLDGLPIRALQETALALGAFVALRRILPALRDRGMRATALGAALLDGCVCAALAWALTQPLSL